MDTAQRQVVRMVIVLLISAIFCAAATYGAINFVRERDSTPAAARQAAGPAQVQIDGLAITLNGDPEKSIYLPDELAPPAGDADDDLLRFEDLSLDPAELIPPAEPIPTDSPLPPTPVPEPIIFVDYVVQSGDSLYGIAEARNSAIELMAQHGIDQDDLIPGNVLSLPVANPDFCPGSRAYVVRDRDTAFRIAQQFGTSAQAIRDLNGLDASYTIRVTQIICVPAG